MTKLLSILLCFTLLFSSVAPSYAQAVQRPSHNPAPVSDEFRSRLIHNITEKVDNTYVAHAHIGDGFNYKSSSFRELQEMEKYVNLLTQDTSAEEEEDEVYSMGAFTKEYTKKVNQVYQQELANRAKFAKFKKEYKQQVQVTYRQALQQTITEEDRLALERWKDSLLAESEIKKAYEEALKAWKKDVLQYNKIELAYLQAQKEVADLSAKNTRKIMDRLAKLGKETLKYKNPVHIYGISPVKDPLSEVLPVFASVGAIDPRVRSEASKILRARIAGAGNTCEGNLSNSEIEKCTQVLQDVGALSVLGTTNEDVWTIAKVLEQGYRGSMGANVITSVGTALLAMDDVPDAYRALTQTIALIVTKYPYSAWDISLSVLSVEEWINAVQQTVQDGPFAEGYENSFYKSDKPFKNLENVWFNLGMEMAEQAKKDAKLQTQLTSLVNGSLLSVQPAGDSVSIRTHHNMLLTGILYGGHQINLHGSPSHQEMNASGHITYTADSRPAIAKWNKKNKELGITQTEYIALQLYFAGMADLDPWTARYFKNHLCVVFERNGKKAEGVFRRFYATEQEVSSFQNWQTAKKVGFVTDIALIALAVFTLGASLVKNLGTFFKTVGRMTKMARVAAASGRAASTSQAFARIARVGRFYKYGTTSVTQIMRGSARTAAAGISKSGFSFKEISIPKPPVTSPKKLSTPKIPKKTKAPVLPATTIELDGELRIVPGGMRYVRVGEHLELVDASKSLQEIAKSFKIDVSAVREVQAGESMHEVVVTQYSYSTGDGSLGSTGSQPLVSAAPAAETATQTASAFSSLQPTWRRVKVQNALGQWVDGWSPIYPQPAEPAWKSLSWRDRLLSFRLEAGDFFRGIGRMVRTQVGALTFAMGTSIASVPMEATAMERAALSGAPIHMTMQPMVSEEVLRISALSTDLSKGANMGARVASTPAKSSLKLSNIRQLTPGTERLSFNAKPFTPTIPRLAAAFETPVGAFQSSARISLATPSGMIPLFPTLQTPRLSTRLESPVVENSSEPKGNSNNQTATDSQPAKSHVGMSQVEISKKPTWSQRLLSMAASVYPSVLAKSWFQKLMGPITDTYYYRYQTVVFNPRTKKIRRLIASDAIEAGEEVFKVAQKYFFIAPPKADENAIIASVLEQFRKEAVAANKPIDQKELEREIEKRLASTKEAIAVRRANDLAAYVLSNSLATRDNLIWVLASAADVTHKMKAVKLLEENGFPPATLEEVINRRRELDRLTYLNVRLNKGELEEIETRVTARIQEENQGELVPQDDPLLTQGLTQRQLTDVDQNLLTQVLMPEEGVADLLRFSTRQTANGNTVYDKVLPVYIRNADGDVSANPQVYLLLNKPFTMPRGFRAVLDESGHFKVAPQNLREVQATSMLQPYNSFFKFLYKIQPDFLDKLPWVKNNPRRLLNWDSASRRRVFETPLKASELAALSYTLSTRPKQVAVLTTAQTDQFETLMLLLALIAGADLGASLSSQLKHTIDWEFVVAFMSGFGYLSPLLANLFKPAIKKYGSYSVIKGGLLTMLGISTLGTMNGMWGTFNPAAGPVNLGFAILFMATAIITASVFSTLSGPVLKSAYSDPTIFSSKNMAFTTTKGLSRLGVTLGTAAFIAIATGIMNYFNIVVPESEKPNWSFLVPVMAGLSMWGLHALRNSRLAKEHHAAVAQQKKDAEQAAARKQTVDPEAEAQRLQAEAAQEARHKAEMAAKYKSVFEKPLKGITTRLGMIYLSYAIINSVVIGVISGLLFSPSTGLAITAGGLFISWLIRKFADKLIKARVITEDQLTGMSLPLMLSGIVGSLVAPFGSPVMFLSWFLMYLSTPTFGVSENTRMMNFVASYYKAARKAVENNSKLTAAEKEARLKELNAEQQDMKAEAAASYNSHNAWGLYTILGTVVMLLLAKDMMNTEIGQTVGEWIKQATDFIRIGGADSTDIAKAGKAATAPLDFAIYRFSMLAPAFFALALNWMNRGMIFQGTKRLLSSIRLTQDMIQHHPEQAPKELQIDFDREQDLVNEIQKEVEELEASVRPLVNSRTAEERLQGLANRLVWANNRLKAAVTYSPLLAHALSSELRTMKTLGGMFMSVVDFNDVSDGLRNQATKLYESLSGIDVEETKKAQSPTDQFLAFLGTLKKMSAYRRDDAVNQAIATISQNIQEGELAAFQGSLETLQGLLKTKKDQRKVASLGRAVVRALEQRERNNTESRFVYLPEVKLSLFDAFGQALHIGNPSRGIFSGTSVQDYEHAKLILRELENMLAEAKAGQVANGMFDTFEEFYNRAMTSLHRYVKKNTRYGQPVDSRVERLKSELDNVYLQYMGKRPPVTSLGGSEESSSGGDNLTPPTELVPVN